MSFCNSKEAFQLDDLVTPCNMIILGATTCGKTTLLRELMAKQLVDKHDMTIVLAPTARVSGDYDVFKESERFVIRDKEIEKRLEEILKKQKALFKLDPIKAPKILIILDDCLGEKSLLFNGLIDSLSVSARHYKISLCVLIQSLRRVPYNFRVNTRYLLAFSASNFRELEALLQEFSPKKYQKAFTENLPIIFKEQYNFIFCQCFHFNPLERLWLVNKDGEGKNILLEILNVGKDEKS